MRIQGIAFALTAVNIVLLVLVLAKVVQPTSQAVAPSVVQASPSTAQSVLPILRGRALELLDEHDRVRSRINVEPSGEVVLRLLDEKGTIRVKLGAGEGGSGLLLLDEATEPGVQIIARRTGTAATPTTTSITLRGAAAKERVIRP